MVYWLRFNAVYIFCFFITFLFFFSQPIQSNQMRNILWTFQFIWNKAQLTISFFQICNFYFESWISCDILLAPFVCIVTQQTPKKKIVNQMKLLQQRPGPLTQNNKMMNIILERALSKKTKIRTKSHDNWIGVVLFFVVVVQPFFQFTKLCPIALVFLRFEYTQNKCTPHHKIQRMKMKMGGRFVLQLIRTQIHRIIHEAYTQIFAK